ncbi:hypothetical protein CBR_g23834 [Chara braunii]|uniref:CCHC-type domain-containing protein n=1 Tax=Chara braunii TaxID=69332 RepID=A0A388JVU5_CHABU|nr:hypothetical protein CBR_g23834 [Chara braunii]|eukprot:GBG61883.1 hypothetical protein CBR_g23834 [Chara braunii]
MYPPQATPGAYPGNYDGSAHTPSPAPTPPLPPPPPPPPLSQPAAPGGACYNCGEYGHYARDCPHRQNGRGWQGQGRGSYGSGSYGQAAYNQPRRNEDEDRMNRLLSFVENQQLEAAEKKRVDQEKKRQEEEKQRLEEAKLREEAEKRWTQTIMEATAAQAFAKEMAALEEKIKDHVNVKITVSEEKSTKLQDSLMRFLEREADAGERSAATPITKKRTAITRKGKEPASAEPKKGAVASSSKQGVIYFVLELRESMQLKQAPELKRMCKVKNIRWVSKAQAIKDLVATEARVAYDGWLTGAESDESKKDDGRSGLVRVVWKKNKMVEQTLTNHRETAREETGKCTCSKDQLPRVEGHVLTRIAQCSLVPMFMHNGKNILQSGVGVKPMEVQRAVKRSLGMVMRRDMYQVAGEECFQDIVLDQIEARPACSEERARELACRLNHLVVVPVDRNPGGMVIMCPATYHHGLQMMFNLNAAYHQVSGQSEKEVLARLRTEFKKFGLDKLGEWNPAAELGRAYVLPKHKDLTRWRPIAPANAEGSKTAGRRLARALNFLLERVPKVRHFNLKATTLLK